MKKTLPYGVQDYFPDECYNKSVVEEKLCAVFSSYGYNKVETPTFEYYDMYAGVPVSSDRMFKLTDNDGSLLVLRPDITLQVCRIAGKLEGGIQKLYYTENSYEYLPNIYSARTREFSQAGVELLGDTGLRGDAEIIKMAIESLLRVGLEDFLIEIGDVRYFKSLMDECGMAEADTAVLQSLINRKDSLGMEMFLQQCPVEKRFKDKFRLLPSLFGDVSVLDTAALDCGEKSAAVLQDLKTIFSMLDKCGYGKYVSVDLGLLHGLDYYSGLVIRGLTGNLGLSVLDGGRYDDIGRSFKAGMNAVGFAIGVKRLLVALDSAHKLCKRPPCLYAYAVAGGDEAGVDSVLRSLRADGARVTDSFCGDRETLVAFCVENAIGNALLFTAEGMETIRVREAEECGR